MAIESVIHTNRQSIDRVLNAGLPVLLDLLGRRPSGAGVHSTRRWTGLAQPICGKALLAKVDAAAEEELGSGSRWPHCLHTCW